MCVKHIILLDGVAGSSVNVFDVEGTSYAPDGRILGVEKLISGDKLAGNLKKFAQCMAICNESKLYMDKGRV